MELGSDCRTVLLVNAKMNSTKKWTAVNKQELILEVWEALDCESVGSRELEQIQVVLQERFGEGGQESPAAIARVVADEGAVLRHPEVFECDTNWRLRKLRSQSYEQQLDFSDFDKAVASFRLLDKAQSEVSNQNGPAANRLREVVLNARLNTVMVSRSKILLAEERERAKEISQWFTVWLQSPQLFADWLELRLRSTEFRNKFPHYP
jgi:hypothetical protein